MEFSIAEIIAIGALILNVIVYFSRVPTRKDLNDLRIELRGEIGELRSEVRDARNETRNEITELRGEIGELRSEMNVRFTKLDESFTNHLMFMHGDARQPPTQGEDK
jgi:HAMP domain-containing protein